ncbi:MAG: hypothetical protein A2513_03470 [Sulfurimonas sp. RIFOXYD12_FULL_33_39]|uniref:response regulator n=1 Tax=unclassified Sulfurimonas TaxID=2623549 RepID=UPI0008CF5BDA|nr:MULTISPECIES: response regulator [unclassified Sulfurimonas]OHE09202.1 MAG: hypothetical protein A2513_03470 [Sulfurimonas sp. RIFOXYD12_FULL_33_39]OHE13015.1 MAG: hypothetical protein A2530_05335 [Sulfurimonas sp. RIFOXYD2_FULL_34_21]
MMPTNVLIIDDSKAITKVITKILLSNKISNYFFHEEHIYIAYDGMQAFELLSKNPKISLVISDVMMPELNGEELIEMLIDTDKIKTLEVIFITTLMNKNNISKKIKESIKGVIYKPFNTVSFSDFFNEIQIEHKKKLHNQQKIKSNHVKQMKYIRTWVQDYCDEENINISLEILEPIISDEFTHHYVIDKDEIYMIYQMILENYINVVNSSCKLNNLLMKKIYNIWHEPERYKPLGVSEDFNNIILNAQNSLTDLSKKDDVRYSIILPLNHLLIQIKNRVKVKQKLSYDDFMPYMDKLLDVFLEIDLKYDNSEILLILNHIKEIERFESELKSLLNKSKLVELFVNLNKAPHLLDGVSNHINTCIKYIKQQIITLYVFKANELAWQKAKKSSNIVAYLKSNLKFKMINTHNVLHEWGIIDKSNIKRFQKYDRERIILATKDLKILEVFKKNLVADMPSLDILIFNTTSILKSELEKCTYTRIVVDLDFTNSVFSNGIQLIKLLTKKYPDIEKIVHDNGLYLLVTVAQAEMLKKSKITFKYKIFLKPLDNKKIFSQFYLEN